MRDDCAELSRADLLGTRCLLAAQHGRQLLGHDGLLSMKTAALLEATFVVGRVDEDVEVRLNKAGGIWTATDDAILKNILRGQPFVQNATFFLADFTCSTSAVLSVNAKKAVAVDNAAFAVGQLSSATKITIEHLEDNDIDAEAWASSVSGKVTGYADMVHTVIREVTSRIVGRKKYGSYTRGSAGIIITGASGSGKSYFAKAMLDTSPIPATYINCSDLYHTDGGESERQLLRLFSTGQRRHLVILDDMEAISSRNISTSEGLTYRLKSLLLCCLDSVIDVSAPLIVVGVTSRISTIDPIFLRSGRLDKTYELTMSSKKQNYDALAALTSRLTFTDRDHLLNHVAEKTHGFYPADLNLLVFSAAQVAISEHLDNNQEGEEYTVYQRHFDKALQEVLPANLNEFRTTLPRITFSDLFGMQSIIDEIQRTVILPFRNPTLFGQLGFRPNGGLLVHGPPGVGKSHLCYAVARELGVNFVAVQATQIRSKVVGESEQNIARLFETARKSAPCILFIDQIEVLGARRSSSMSSENTADRIVTSLLTEMDGVLTKTVSTSHIDVFILAATNRVDVLDPALLRPGRLDQHVALYAPTTEQRTKILNGFLANMPHAFTEQEILQIAESTHGYSGADLESVLREAALIALRRNIQATQMILEHVELALKVVNPSLL